MTTPLIRIVDDDPLFRTSTAMLLNMKGWETKEYDSAARFLDEEDFRRPGCLILDVRMPGMSGLELQRKLEENGNPLPVIFLTGHGDITMAVHAMRHGACDFLEKPVDIDVLSSSVKRFIALSIEICGKRKDLETIQRRINSLTPREYEVIVLAARNLPNKRIGNELGIAEPTVKMHRANAFAKLEVNNPHDAFLLLQKAGVIKEEDNADE